MIRFAAAKQQAISMKLNNKVAVVTGAARGIGKAIAERYVSEGAKVIIADLNEQGADAVATALGGSAAIPGKNR